MKRFERLLILVPALTASGGLAYMFVPDFEPIKMIILAIVILIGKKRVVSKESARFFLSNSK